MMETRFAKFVLAFGSVVLIYVAPSFGRIYDRSTEPPAYVQQVTVEVDNKEIYRAKWKDGEKSNTSPYLDSQTMVVNSRELTVTKSLPLPKKGNAKVYISFSRPVKNVNLQFRFVKGEIDLKKKNNVRKVWSGKFNIEKMRSHLGSLASIPMWITAKDLLYDRKLDGDPSTIPQWDSKAKKWQRVEKGKDLNYWLKLRKGTNPYETKRLWRIGHQMEFHKVVTEELDGSYKFPVLDVPPAYQIEARLKKFKGDAKKFLILHYYNGKPHPKPLRIEEPLTTITRDHTLEYTNHDLKYFISCGVELKEGLAQQFQLQVRLIDRGDLGTHCDAGDIRTTTKKSPDGKRDIDVDHTDNGLDISIREWHTANLFGYDMVDYFRLPNVPKGTHVWVEIRNLVYYELYDGEKNAADKSSIKIRIQEETFVNGTAKREDIDHPDFEVKDKRKENRVSSEVHTTKKPCNIWFKIATTKANANISYQIRIGIDHIGGLGVLDPGN